MSTPKSLKDSPDKTANYVGGEITLRQLCITGKYMIDRESRNKMASLLQDWLDGRIGVETLLEQVPGQSQDPVIEALAHGFAKIPCGALHSDCGEWETCTDTCHKCRKHKGDEWMIKISQGKQCLKRAIVFLRTGLEYSWGTADDNRTDWREAITLLPKAIGIAILILGTLVLAIWGATELNYYMLKHGCSEIIAGRAGEFLFILWPIGLVGFLVYTNRQHWSADWRYWPFHDRKEYEAAISQNQPPITE